MNDNILDVLSRSVRLICGLLPYSIKIIENIGKSHQKAIFLKLKQLNRLECVMDG